jgi:hypothetical protein
MLNPISKVVVAGWPLWLEPESLWSTGLPVGGHNAY